MNPRERLVFHVQELERLETLKADASALLTDAFQAAAAAGFDPKTLKVVLKLRKMTPEQRRERRALEAIYMATLGMLEGDSLPDVARRRPDEKDEERQPDRGASKPPDESSEPDAGESKREPPTEETPARPPEQPPLIVKDPEEARQEGADAAAAGKRIYDNPYRAGDPCRAAWDEGWCAQQKSHGMETPAAYQRRSAKPPDKDEKPDKKGGAAGGDEEAA